MKNNPNAEAGTEVIFSETKLNQSSDTIDNPNSLLNEWYSLWDTNNPSEKSTNSDEPISTAINPAPENQLALDSTLDKKNLSLTVTCDDIQSASCFIAYFKNRSSLYTHQKYGARIKAESITFMLKEADNFTELMAEFLQIDSYMKRKEMDGYHFNISLNNLYKSTLILKNELALDSILDKKDVSLSVICDEIYIAQWIAAHFKRSKLYTAKKYERHREATSVIFTLNKADNFNELIKEFLQTDNYMKAKEKEGCHFDFSISHNVSQQLYSTPSNTKLNDVSPRVVTIAQTPLSFLSNMTIPNTTATPETPKGEAIDLYQQYQKKQRRQ